MLWRVHPVGTGRLADTWCLLSQFASIELVQNKVDAMLEIQLRHHHIWGNRAPEKHMRTLHRSATADIGFLLDELRLAGVTTYAKRSVSRVVMAGERRSRR